MAIAARLIWMLRVDQGYSLIREWFDPKEEPYDNERDTCEGLVWQCRYSGVEVPDSLCSCADIGVGKLYADDQADALESEPAALAAFDESTHRFTQHVGSKGKCRGCRRCCPRRKVHHPIIVRQPTHPGRDESSLRNFLRGISVSASRGEKDHGSILQVRIQRREERH